MGKTFFVDWELWQKMTFCLASAMLQVLVIFIGLCKLQYDKHRIRKYSKVDKGKQTQTPEMLEAQPVKQEEKEYVPFGIRAIESGIEVDGVWISRSNTPVGSSRSSIAEGKFPSSRNSSQLELPKAIHGGSSSRASSQTAFDRAVSAERIYASSSRDSSPGRDNSSQARGRVPLPSHAQYCNGNTQRNSTTLNALEGMEASSSQAPNNGQPSASTSGKSSARTSDEADSEYLRLNDGRPYEAAYFNSARGSLAPIDPRTDLDLLQSHRLSHVAETGQLTPRVRKPGNSGEWASVAANLRSPQEISTSNGVDYFVPRQKDPSPPLPPTLSTPDEAPLPSTSKLNLDGHSSNQAKQAVPLLETYQPRPVYSPEAYQPRGPHHEYEDESAHYAVQTTQNSQRDTQILRKVNSGFEILRPGTFGEPPSPEEDKLPNDRRQSKKLQKRRKSSSASRTSHFHEQV
ncbi:hypothetical protein EJ04DRAFT_534230 [Polyplosphaeria fusca]|uniref:Uncharacterized protein n=1 Tax=Polyplosphaeria fusca TaxID=682080 RepID=A0A9P4V3L9_9PLEO|nr:hypothetical protein EJ04DRAFT_534230 [Polyplosphaeria fusca]